MLLRPAPRAFLRKSSWGQPGCVPNTLEAGPKSFSAQKLSGPALQVQALS
ncbi:hypothetical protein CROQUDRAFT_95668 [Cronartium quercuum f. sp. fusiforme G11]|uniref:Uncharacterized protein n=1 Tax=Cronartium quercuum f. sp. fusiforme G11 TaxID=708437 RepID=A0A9P6NC20_9BASI|nr:hypothetical protein CROQUDRAFT_95668 [Cronartium quercuum f. sp. fusiforme G11]